MNRSDIINYLIKKYNILIKDEIHYVQYGSLV